MPPSAVESPGRALAVTAEALFLVNLLVLPGVAFLGLCVLWWRYGTTAAPLARQHLRQALVVSFWGGVLIVSCSAALLLIGGWHGALTWVALILYFTCIHSTLVVFGIVGLARAMAGQSFRYPIIGPRP